MGIGLKGFMVYKVFFDQLGSGIDVCLCIGVGEMGLGFTQWCFLFVFYHLLGRALSES